MARMIMNAVIASAAVAPSRSTVGGVPSAICDRPLAILKRYTPGSIETTDAKPTPANGICQRRETGVRTRATNAHAIRAPLATPAPNKEIEAQRAACASMPTATGHGHIFSGVE